VHDEPDRDLLRRFAHGDREAFEMTVYYLAWKYLVGFLNQEMGIA
jgi:hypothetical protein